MKKITLLCSILTLLIFTISFQAPLEASEDTTEDCGDWMCGGAMANVYVYTGLPSGFTRTKCCTYSDPENACHMPSQEDSHCNSWRINQSFFVTYPIHL